MKKFRVFSAIGLILLGFIALIGVTGCQTAGPKTVTVSMTNLDTFDPQTVFINPGDTVKWMNDGTDPHAPRIDPLNVAPGGPNSDLTFPAGVQPGTSYSWISPTPALSGTKWYYHCRFHGVAGNGTSLGSGMVGVIIIN